MLIDSIYFVAKPLRFIHRNESVSEYAFIGFRATRGNCRCEQKRTGNTVRLTNHITHVRPLANCAIPPQRRRASGLATRCHLVSLRASYLGSLNKLLYV